MKIGLIGVGELGSAIAHNYLKTTHELLVYDRRPEAAAPFVARGAGAAGSAAELAAAVDVVLTALPTPAVVEAALLGPDGVLAAMRPGSIWIDHSTNSRTLLQTIAARAAERQIGVVEAPVTGGIPLAHEGRITVLVGADRPLFERVEPLLSVVGRPVIHLGPVGSATVVKVMTNMLAFIHLWALGEGLMLATAAGLDTGAVFEAIKASCGSSFVAETEGPPILTGTYDYGFTLELAMKDMRLALEIAAESGVPLEMGGLTHHILERGVARYGPSFWSTGIVRLLEDDLGIPLRAAGYEPDGRWAAYEKRG